MRFLEMRFLEMKRALAIAMLVLPACLGTTGSSIVSFRWRPRPGGCRGWADTGVRYGRGWHVELTKATLYIGAVYLDESVPVSGAQDTSCILEGVYAGQETSGLSVNVLSPDPQPFPAPGNGTGDLAITGEVWLAGGDVNASDDPTIIVDVAGTASASGRAIPSRPA